MAKAVTNERPSQVMRQETWLKTASVAGLRGDWITVLSGYAKRATTTTPFVVGILTADWTNDSSNDPVQVTADELGTYLMDASTTLVQATHVGVAYDLSDERTLNLGATTYKPLWVKGISPDGRAFVGISKYAPQ